MRADSRQEVLLHEY